MVYRLIAHQEPARIDFQAQIHEGDAGWMTLADWSVDIPEDLPGRKLTERIRTEAAEAGWMIESKASGTPRVYEARPIDWHAVLQAASSRRTATTQAAEEADLAWRLLVQDAPTSRGMPGYVSKNEIAKMAGLTRYRIYQVVGDESD